MLQKADTTPQLKEWIDRLAPVVEESKEILQHRTPSKLVMYSGCEQDADGNFRLEFFWQGYVISVEDFTVRRARDGKEPSSFIQSLILTYLVSANGTTPSRRWIGFRELPDGIFCAQAFRGYTGIRLVRLLEGGMEAFGRAAEALDSVPRDEREISSVTLCVSQDVMLDLKERIREFRRELLQVAELGGAPERVVQINFQLFPLSEQQENDHD